MASSTVSADDSVVDQINITVPVSCTMSGTGMNTHNAEIQNGTYTADIGTTTLTAFCNDNNGFAIYAVGFTDNEYGKNVLTNSTLGNTYDIATGIATSGDTSNWAMKLTMTQDSGDTTSTNAFTIDSAPNTTGGTDVSFTNYHTVPSEYVKVAHKNTNTDMTTSTGGVKLTTTYAVFINKTQPAGTYTGQVKYTLVHPVSHIAPDEFFGETLQSVADWGGKVALGQTVTVTDSRDNQEYTVARLADGKLWMTKNLRLDLSKAKITADNTNNPTSAFLAAASSTSSSDTWCTDSNSTCTDQIKYNTSNIGNTTTDLDGHTYDEYGVYYNWYTATAGNGTYSTASNTTVTGDICPAGWHLPTSTNTSGSYSNWTGDYWELVAALGGGIAQDGSNYNDIVGANGSTRLKSSPNNFLYSGYFSSTTFSGLGEYGYYWMSSKNSSLSAYMLVFGNTSVSPANANIPAFLGTPIRCVANPTPYQLIVQYDEGIDSIAIDGVTVNNGGTVMLFTGSTHTIEATVDSNYNFSEWTVTSGSIANISSLSTTLTMGYNSTLTASTTPIIGFDTAFMAASKSKYNGYYKMQDADSSICSAVSEGEIGELIDERDDTVYKVRKLADGNCWMLDNLALDPTDPTTASKMNTTNTNATAEAIANFLNGGSSTTGWSSVAVVNATTNFSDTGGYVQPRINNASRDTLVTSYGPASSNGQAKVGIYYNFCAASASTYCYANGQGVDAPDTIIDASQDICPANWRIPTGGDTGEYLILKQKYGNNATEANSLQYNLSMPLSGYYVGNSASGQNSFGYWWSSTYLDGYHMSSLFASSSSWSLDGSSRYYGHLVRCLVAE